MSYDSEIMDKLLECYSEGIVEVLCSETENYFDLIGSNFPIGLNRINWDRVPNHEVLEVLSDSEFNSRIEILSFLQGLKKKGFIDEDDEVCVFGDDSLENVYKMPFYALEENAMLFFTLPQHTYVFCLSGNWCINYTFEDYLFFGFGLEKKKHL